MGQELLEQLLSRLEAVRGPDRQGYYTARCPQASFHRQGDRHPSLRLWATGYLCWQPACPLSQGGSLRHLAALLGLPTSSPRNDRPASGNGHRRHDRIALSPLAWWAERCGLPAAFVRRELPLEEREDCLALVWPGLPTRKLRRVGDKSWWWEPKDAPQPVLWPALPESTPPLLVLTEGESDATVARYIMRALELEGLASAHAVTKGAGMRPEGALLWELRERGVHALLLLSDADAAGDEMAAAWERACQAAGLPAWRCDLVAVRLVSPSLGEKDLRDAFRRQPQRAMSALRDALLALADQARRGGHDAARWLAAREPWLETADPRREWPSDAPGWPRNGG